MTDISTAVDAAESRSAIETLGQAGLVQLQLTRLVREAGDDGRLQIYFLDNGDKYRFPAFTIEQDRDDHLVITTSGLNGPSVSEGLSALLDEITYPEIIGMKDRASFEPAFDPNATPLVRQVTVKRLNGGLVDAFVLKEHGIVLGDSIRIEISRIDGRRATGLELGQEAALKVFSGE